MSKNTSGALSFDWVSFTIKPDKKARDTHYINLTEVLHLLSICEDKFKSFIDLGPRLFYDRCFKLDNIRIYATDTGMLLHPDSKSGEDGFKDYMNQGFNVEFSGQGCREYENIRLESDGAGLDTFSCWFSLFYALRCAVDSGCVVNFTRLDIALDCYDGTITVDKVREALRLGEVVTAFRTYTDSESEPITSVKRLSLKGEVLGNSITIGNRKSNTHVCIYDKLSEQKNKYKHDSVSLYKLRKLDSWTRFEIRIRNSVANGFMSGLLDSWLSRKRQDYSEVSEYIGSFINSKIRFVHLDNNRKCRCSLKNWWATFIGSCMKLKLASIKPVVNVCRRAVNYVKHSLAPTLFSLAMKFSREGLWDIISEGAQEGNRLKDKHMKIVQAADMNEELYSNSDYWSSFYYDVQRLKVAV